MFGSRRATPPPSNRARLVGLDLSATRMRAVAAADGRSRPLVLDDPHDELPLLVTLDRRQPAVGHAAQEVVRTNPHAVCSGFLGLLGDDHMWEGERLKLDAEGALAAVLKAAGDIIRRETTTAGLALPGYLSARQVGQALGLVAAAKLPVRGSVSAPLAVVSHRAGTLGEVWPRGYDPTVLVIDVDDFAFTATLVQITPTEVVHVADDHWRKASLKVWKDRLIDGLADRSVRTCRRDPRDSAAAEQHLYLQLDAALDAARAGQRITLTIRSDHWYQDLTLNPDEMDALGTPVLRPLAEGLKEFLLAADLTHPPRAVWLSHTAARLPGLAATIYRHSPDTTLVSILPVNATAEAAAAILPRWLTAAAPAEHLAAVIPHAAPIDLPDLPDKRISSKVLPPR